MSEWQCVNVQAAHHSHMNVVRELLNHGANVTEAMVLCPRIEQPMKELLGNHLVVYVFFLATDVLVLLYKPLILSACLQYLGKYVK